MNQRQRTLYRFTPFLLLLILLGIINLAPRLGPSFMPARPTHTPPPTPSQPSPTLTARQTAVFATTTFTPPPTPSNPGTPTPSPVQPTPAPISLLGPPAHSRFQPGQLITFYWTWPGSLQETQQFSVYWLREGELILLGSLPAPNLGQTVYRLTASIPESGAFAWQVRLETTPSGELILAGETRPLTILSPP